MRKFTGIKLLSLAALSYSGLSNAASDTGFIDGSTASLQLRNFFINRS